MLALHQIYPHLRQGDWLCAIDLCDAYFHIPITKKHRKFLRFTVGKCHYQFAVLPFGLKSAARTFSKCMAVVAAHLRKQRIFVYSYLDDWLIKASSCLEAQQHFEWTLQLLQKLGLQVNLLKSTATPVQRKHYLGAIVDTRLGKVFPSEERRLSILQKCKQLQERSQATARIIASLLGSMASCIHLVPNARLHIRPLQENLEDQWCQLRDDWENKVLLSPHTLQSLKWWCLPSNLLVGIPFQQRPPSQTIVTDASLLGWGAHMEHLRVQGEWSQRESLYHINLLELRAVHLALKAFLPSLRTETLLLQTDNVATMYYVNKQGGTRSRILSREAQTIWHWLLARNLSLVATHLPGIQNVQADALSRVMDENHEWVLHDDVVHSIFALWGTPSTDLFATPDNKKCQNFASRYYHPGTLGNALWISWSGAFLYAFPPLPLIPAVLQKLSNAQTKMILIAPEWPRQWWFPDLLHRSLKPHIRLPYRPDLFTKFRGQISHPNPSSLSLAAWLLS
ncbi:hypothetical protein NDU88_002594 [Pleurodeles waltl]|uniref:ribonuclease H n=1 Tax=Pleurodeles waltl TaxID=8319 RepID=A0AAV7NFU9_PLEWA|nr:hypothetical protein NDU88_002594 [Pleurodeles waltl]